MAKHRYPDVQAGEEFRLKWKEHAWKPACCDCHLVHWFDMRVEGDEIVIVGSRDNRATAQLRRWRGIPIVERKNKGHAKSQG